MNKPNYISFLRFFSFKQIGYYTLLLEKKKIYVVFIMFESMVPEHSPMK